MWNDVFWCCGAEEGSSARGGASWAVGSVADERRKMRIFLRRALHRGYRAASEVVEGPSVACPDGLSVDRGAVRRVA